MNWKQCSETSGAVGSAALGPQLVCFGWKFTFPFLAEIGPSEQQPSGADDKVKQSKGEAKQLTL